MTNSAGNVVVSITEPISMTTNGATAASGKVLSTGGSGRVRVAEGLILTGLLMASMAVLGLLALL